MATAPDTALATLYKFFGKRPGQGLKEFKAELDELTPEDKAHLLRTKEKT
jgi:hypothetical protein